MKAIDQGSGAKREGVRSFLALVPDKVSMQELLGYIDHLQTECKRQVPLNPQPATRPQNQFHAAMRWQTENQLHLTLQFLDNQPTQALSTLWQQILSQLDQSPTQTASPSERTATPSPVGLSTLAHKTRQHHRPSGCLAIEFGTTPFLTRMHQLASSSSSAYLTSPDKRRWRPHLTLARFRNMRSFTAISPPPSVVFDCLTLMTSHSHPGGSHYHREFEYLW